MGLLNDAVFLSNLVLAKLQKKNVPLTVIFNLTDSCNLKCAYCYAGYHRRGKPELSQDEVIAILDELAELGCKRVSLAGGEPLLRDDIGDIVEHVIRRGMNCVVNSNGVLVPEKIELLRSVDSLCLSLDGNEESHDVFRGQGSFRNVIAAIECARENNIPVLTNTVLHRYNSEQIEFVLDLADKYGFQCLFNMSIGHLAAPDKDISFKADDQAIKEALQRLIRYRKGGRSIFFSAEAFKYTLLWPSYQVESYLYRPPDFPSLKCWAGRYFCTIDTNGDVYPCTHLIGMFAAKNSVKQGFAECFAALSQHPCKACYQICHNEFNMIFALHPEIIFSYVTRSLRRILRLDGSGTGGV